MKSEKKNSALSAGIGYTIGNILIRGISILTLPIFSRLMTTEEFGVFNVFMSYDSILVVLVGLAMHSSIRSANLKFKGEIDGYTSSVSLIYLLGAALLTAMVLLFGGTLSNLLGFDNTLLYLLIVHSTASALLTLYNTRVSLEYSYKKYLLAAVINSVGTILVSLVLILTVFRSQRDVGRILGSTSVLAVLAMGILATFYRRARPRFHRDYWSFGLKYSLPIVPHGVSQMLLAQFDRIMISRMVSDSAAGIYSLAGNLKLIMTVITTSISAVWNTWFFGRMDKNENASIQKRAVQLGAMYTILVVGLMALSPELILILGGREYDLARYVAIPMILDALILFFYDLVVSGEYYAKKTVYIMLATLVAAALNVVLNYVFILRYGFVAAAYTTLVSYVVYLLIHVVICRKMLKFFVLPVKWLLAFSAIAAIMAAVDLLLMDSLVLRWALCAAVVIPMGLLLLRSVGGMGMLLNKRNGKENVQ